jgi:eukaryotic-like serine/threonine-protein kinase
VLLAAQLAENGDSSAALKQLTLALRAMDGARPEAHRRPSSIAVAASARVLLGELLRRRGARDEARNAWQQALEELEPIMTDSMDYRLLDPWARALLHLGRKSEAEQVLNGLRAVGYSKPGFWAFCSGRSLGKTETAISMSQVSKE